MDIADLLTDGFERVRGRVEATVDGLSADALSFRVDADANSIAWLVWHLTRIQDDHVADAAGIEQVWTAEAWAERFALPFEPGDTGYAHSSAEVAAVHVGSPELLSGYHQAVFEQTKRFVDQLQPVDLDRIVDESFDPPVTLGVRLVSVIADDLQHIGQAAYVRGLAERNS